MTMFIPANRPNRTPLRETNAVQGTWLLLGASGTGYTSLAALQAAGDTLPPNQYQAPPGANFGGMDLTVTNDGTGQQAGSIFYLAINPKNLPSILAEGIQVEAGGNYGPIQGQFYQIWFLKTVSSDRLTFEFAF